MTVVLKLGGSVITEKDRPSTVHQPALEQAARVIADAGVDRLVLVHGGGSFGHPAAEEHGVTESIGTHDDHAVRAIHDAMRRLNDAVVHQLAEAAVPAVPVHPSSAAARSADGTLRMESYTVATLLDEGFVPVLHGDGVAHAGSGVSVLSGDEVVAHLAAGLSADRVGLCSTVPGVLDADGEVVDSISEYEDVADSLHGSHTTDVTGGMAGKVRALLALEGPSFIFDLDGLADFLAGGSPGTRIER